MKIFCHLPIQTSVEEIALLTSTGTKYEGPPEELLKPLPVDGNCSTAGQKYSISMQELEVPIPEPFSPSCSGSAMIDWYRRSVWGGWFFVSYWSEIGLMIIENWLAAITIDIFFRRIKVLFLQIEVERFFMLLSETREFCSRNNCKNSNRKEDEGITLYLWHGLYFLYVLIVCLFVS